MKNRVGLAIVKIGSVGILALASCAAKPPIAHHESEPSKNETHAPSGHVCTQTPVLSTGPEPIDGAVASIVRVEVRGAKAGDAICQAIQTSSGTLVDGRRIEADLRRIWELGGIDDVVVARELAPGGVVVAFEVKERARFSSARIDGIRSANVGRDEDYLPDPGPLDPLRIHASVTKLAHALSDQGFRHAQIETHTEPQEDDALELVITVGLGSRSQVRSITFPGVDPARSDELGRLLTTHVGAPLLDDALERDTLLVQNDYFDHGMLNATVHPPIIKESSNGEGLDIAIEIDGGPVYKLGRLKVTGDLLDREADYKKRFWSTAEGAIFKRSVIIADLDRIREYHRSQGYNAELEPETNLKADKKVVDMTIHIKKH